MSFATVLVILLTSAFIYICYEKFKRRNVLKNLPCPKPNFFLGNLIEFVGVPKHEQLLVISRLVHTYGPNLKLHLGPYEYSAIVADIRFIEYILRSQKLIDKSIYYSILHDWIGTGLLTSTGIKWKKRRRMITPAFHFGVLENFVQIFENVSDIFIGKLHSEVDKDSVNVAPLTTLCTLDIICEAAMGTQINAQNNKDSEYVQSVKLMCSIFIEKMLTPLHKSLLFLTPSYYREKRALKILHGYTESIINKRILEKSTKIHNETAKGNKRRLAFLDILLESTIDGQPLSRMDIREEVDTFMFEGHDTTSSAINFALYCLANNQEVQKMAVEEQKLLFPKMDDVRPTVAQLQEMKYLEMVIKETLRLYPPVPLIARSLAEDVEWEGQIFPKDLNILIPAYVIHRNPTYFSNPESFIPERFSDMSARDTWTYLPFSAGPRNCIGQKFAMLEMKTILSKVLRNFELHPTSPKHELKLAPDIVLDSINGVYISLKRRG